MEPLRIDEIMIYLVKKVGVIFMSSTAILRDHRGHLVTIQHLGIT
jgi:hypothetical protein